MQTSVKKNRMLKAYRVSNGMTQEQFSNKADIAFSTYVSKENGHRKFTQDEMKRIKDAFELTSEEINGIFF